MVALVDTKELGETSGNTVLEGPSWSPVRSNSVASQIVIQVRDALFAGKLKPGDALGAEKDLAAKFSVSRITVRDALRTLETMGIVEIKVGAGGGARIAAGNIERFADALAIQFELSAITRSEILDAQLAIEGATAELAAKNRTDEDLARLSELLDEAESLRDDPIGFTQSGQRFHLALAEASGNRALVAQFKALRYVIWPSHAARAGRDRADHAQSIHRKLVEYVEQGDGENARELMCDHLGQIRDAVLKGDTSPEG